MRHWRLPIIKTTFPFLLLLLFNSIVLDIDGCCKQTEHKLVLLLLKFLCRSVGISIGSARKWRIPHLLVPSCCIQLHFRRVCLSTAHIHPHRERERERESYFFSFCVSFCALRVLFKNLQETEHPQEMQSRHVFLLSLAPFFFIYFWCRNRSRCCLLLLSRRCPLQHTEARARAK